MAYKELGIDDNNACDCQLSCDECKLFETSWSINGFNEVENVRLYQCGKIEDDD